MVVVVVRYSGQTITSVGGTMMVDLGWNCGDKGMLGFGIVWCWGLVFGCGIEWTKLPLFPLTFT